LVEELVGQLSAFEFGLKFAAEKRLVALLSMILSASANELSIKLKDTVDKRNKMKRKKKKKQEINKTKKNWTT
jgi:hypothetical protein